MNSTNIGAPSRELLAQFGGELNTNAYRSLKRFTSSTDCKDHNWHPLFIPIPTNGHHASYADALRTFNILTNIPCTRDNIEDLMHGVLGEINTSGSCGYCKRDVTKRHHKAGKCCSAGGSASTHASICDECLPIINESKYVQACYVCQSCNTEFCDKHLHFIRKNWQHSTPDPKNILCRTCSDRRFKKTKHAS